MDKLKPCPFCGGEAKMVIREDDGGYRAEIHCMSSCEIGCYAVSQHWALKKSWAEDDAVKAWNRRTEGGVSPDKNG